MVGYITWRKEVKVCPGVGCSFMTVINSATECMEQSGGREEPLYF